MTIVSLWLPIIASAVVVFVAGSVVWMFMPWHKTEWKKTPDEEATRAVLKGCPPGMYTVPNLKACGSAASGHRPECLFWTL